MIDDILNLVLTWMDVLKHSLYEPISELDFFHVYNMHASPGPHVPTWLLSSGLNWTKIVSKIWDNIENPLTLSQRGADLSNRLPQLKHLSPVDCLPVRAAGSDGNTICLGSRDRKLSGALHPLTWHRHVDTCSASWSSHTGDTRPGPGPARGSGSWAGQQPRTGSTMKAT